MQAVFLALKYLIPGYLTLLQVSSVEEDQESLNKWTRYWIIIAIFTLLEPSCKPLLKIIFIGWCLLPGYFSASEIIFKQV